MAEELQSLFSIALLFQAHLIFPLWEACFHAAQASPCRNWAPSPMESCTTSLLANNIKALQANRSQAKKVKTQRKSTQGLVFYYLFPLECLAAYESWFDTGWALVFKCLSLKAVFCFFSNFKLWLRKHNKLTCIGQNSIPGTNAESACPDLTLDKFGRVLPGLLLFIFLPPSNSVIVVFAFFFSHSPLFWCTVASQLPSHSRAEAAKEAAWQETVTQIYCQMSRSVLYQCQPGCLSHCHKSTSHKSDFL